MDQRGKTGNVGEFPYIVQTRITIETFYSILPNRTKAENEKKKRKKEEKELRIVGEKER